MKLQWIITFLPVKQKVTSTCLAQVHVCGTTNLIIYIYAWFLAMWIIANINKVLTSRGLFPWRRPSEGLSIYNRSKPENHLLQIRPENQPLSSPSSSRFFVNLHKYSTYLVRVGRVETEQEDRLHEILHDRISSSGSAYLQRASTVPAWIHQLGNLEDAGRK
jgi:hypothetical protein